MTSPFALALRIKTFPDQLIAGLSGDWEFIGEGWISWLGRQGIPFVLRLKENMRVWNESHVPVNLSVHAGGLRKRQSRILKGTWHLGIDLSKETTPIKVAMMRLKTGEMLIVAVSRIRIKTALSTYSNRWSIETLFPALKTRGLGLEDTHITDPHKLATLMSVLAIALCLAYKTGLWLARIKLHGLNPMVGCNARFLLWVSMRSEYPWSKCLNWKSTTI